MCPIWERVRMGEMERMGGKEKETKELRVLFR